MSVETHAHPLYVQPALREAIARALLPLPAGVRVIRVRRKGPDAVTVVLGWPGGEIELGVLEHRGAGAPAFARGAHYAVTIDGSLLVERVRRLAEASARALAAMQPRGLITIPSASAGTGGAVIHLEPDDFGRWLRAIVPPERWGDWTLSAIQAARGGSGLVLSLTDRGGLALEIWLCQSGGEALFDTGALALSYLSTEVEPDRAAQIVFELGMQIEAMQAGIRIRPSRSAVLLALSTPDPHSFQLSLSGPCHQSCSFCCLDPADRREPAPDDPEPWLAKVREAGARGARILRVNGIEPLRARFVPEILASAQRAGFTRIEIKSTVRPLADEALARRILGGLEVAHRIDVPIYGSSAELHDRITGAPGAFDEVMSALEHIRAFANPSCELRIETILVPDNLTDLGALRALADRLGARLAIHLAHPTGDRAAEVYPRSIVRFGDAARAIFPRGGAEPLAELLWGELPVCVEVAHERQSGARCVTAPRLAQRAPSIAGAHYAHTDIGFASAAGNQVEVSATLPCPHRDRCAAGPVCSAEVYALYAAHAGLDELVPLGRDELASLAEGAALLHAIDSARPPA